MDFLAEALVRQIEHLDSIYRANLGRKVLVCAKCYQVLGPNYDRDHRPTESPHIAQPWPIEQVIVKLRSKLESRTV